MIGIGQPQYRWRDSSQSRSRKVTAASPSALGLQVGGDRGDGLVLGHPVVPPAVDQPTVTGRRDARLGRVGATGVDHHPHRQVEGPGEVQVALVVRRDRHDRAGAVVGQDVVGSPDRDLLATDRVDRHPPQRARRS